MLCLSPRFRVPQIQLEALDLLQEEVQLQWQRAILQHHRPWLHYGNSQWEVTVLFLLLQVCWKDFNSIYKSSDHVLFISSENATSAFGRLVWERFTY